ncbi:uncharacterized protein FFNC_15627 [Fusarium fujikuroi]|nr:uncharacterized protein FFNC_15627 [Fusarium fujikuroi]
MDGIESDPYPEDVQKLHDKYGFEVVRSSARVLVNSSPLTMRSTYSLYDFHGLATPSVEVDSDMPKEATWVLEPTPAAERAPSPYDCTPEVGIGLEDDRPTESDGYAEPEAIMGKKYVDIPGEEQEKPGDDDLSLPHDGDGYDKDKAQEGATKPGDSKGDRDIHHEQEFPGKVDIYASYRNRYEDKKGLVSVQLGIQYELTVQLQRYIERACYAFGSGKLPETLTQNGWDCDEAVTLDRWMREFLDRPEVFDITGDNVESPQSLFQRLREIQAVNLSRKRLTSDEIQQFLSDACALMDVLNVSGYKEILKKLELRIGKLLVDFAVRYESFRRRRDEKLKQVKSERARLDMLESTILAEMDDDMEENQSMVKREIRTALDKRAAKFDADIEWEKDRGE